MSIPVAGTAVTVGDTNTSTPTVQSFTTGAGQTYMVVGVGNRAKAEVVASVTFGATSLALIVRQASSGTTQSLEIWGAVVPESTTANVTVTWTTGGGNSTVSIQAYTGVNTANPKGTGVGAQITSPGTLSVNVTSTDYALLVCRELSGAADAATIGAGQSSDFTDFGDGAGQCTQRGSRKNGTNGVVAMQYTSAATSNGNPQIAAFPLYGFDSGGSGGPGFGTSVAQRRFRKLLF